MSQAGAISIAQTGMPEMFALGGKRTLLKAQSQPNVFQG
jgi:hypothetical protein